MEKERKHNCDRVKEILDEYVNTEYEIDGQKERLSYLISKKTSIGSKAMDGMPRSSNSSTDRMADALAKEEELRERITCMIDSQAIKRAKIEAVVRLLKNPEERQVIRLRYFDRATWEEIVYVVYRRKEDYGDRLDTYTRRMYARHRAALENMEKYIGPDGELNTESPAI